MDFIEQWFGLSPDGGDGSVEFFWIVAMVAVIAAFFSRGRIRAGIVSLKGRPSNPRK